MRFLLVDRITSLEAGKSLTAVKSLALSEEYLADHFPGFPVMPGVLMLESLIQAGAWLMRYTEDFRFSTILLRQARGVRFNRFVTPGRTLEMSVTVHKWGKDVCTFKGAATVEGESAVKARLTLAQFNPGDKNPELKESDRFQTDKMRELFSQIAPKSVISDHRQSD